MKIISTKDNYVIVPAAILDSTLQLLPIDGQVTCEGSFKFQNDRSWRIL